MGIDRNYDILFTNISVQGGVASTNTLVAGSGYAEDVYEDVPLTGGKGSGATADITVDSSGNVTGVTLVLAGSGYQVGDVLSADAADLGDAEGSGFSVTVATLSTTVNDFVSEPFNLGEVKSEYRSPALRFHGNLDGGTIYLQSLNPAKNRSNSDNSLSSTDWQNTDDEFDGQSLNPLEFSNLDYRIKLVDLGASADFSAQIVYNAE